jgi:hypothetical protein
LSLFWGIGRCHMILIFPPGPTSTPSSPSVSHVFIPRFFLLHIFKDF